MRSKTFARAIAMLLAAALMVAGFAACSGNQPAATTAATTEATTEAPAAPPATTE